MDVAPVFQPYDRDDTAIMALERQLLNIENTQITLVSAWVKRSALRRLKSAIATFRGRGGFLRIILGLSQGGASKEGLQAALDAADEVYVTFDPNGRTFHPKMYLATGSVEFSVLIGSSNLTASGITTNFEANALITGSQLDATDATDAKFYNSCKEYIEVLVADAGITKRLNVSLINEIEADPQIQLGREDQSQNVVVANSSKTQLFSGSSHPLSTAKPTTKDRHADSLLKRQTPRLETLTKWSSSSENLIWSKLITKANSMRTSAHPTGHLSLTKSTYDIDGSTWFRYNLFGDREWISTLDDNGRSREHCTVDFDVHGLFQTPVTVPLQVDHTPSWQSDQNNRTTSLRWGPLMQTLREDVDTQGSYVIIEKNANGGFILAFARSV